MGASTSSPRPFILWQRTRVNRIQAWLSVIASFLCRSSTHSASGSLEDSTTDMTDHSHREVVVIDDGELIPTRATGTNVILSQDFILEPDAFSVYQYLYDSLVTYVKHILTTYYIGERSGHPGSYLIQPLSNRLKPVNPATRPHKPLDASMNSLAFELRPAGQISSAQQLERSTWNSPSGFMMITDPLPPPIQPCAARDPRPPQSSNPALASTVRNLSENSEPATRLTDRHPTIGSANQGHRDCGPISETPWLGEQCAEVINLEEDSNDRSNLTFTFDSVAKSATPSIQSRVASDARESMGDDKFNSWLAQQASNERRRPLIRSLTPLSLPKFSVQSLSHNGMQLHPKVTIELKGGDFMLIHQVLEDPATKQVFLKGPLFRRVKYMNGTIPKKTNEVCQIVELDESDSRSAKEQAFAETSVTEVKKWRGLMLTNQGFPALSYREDPCVGDSQSDIEERRVLVCRWRYICVYANATAQDKNMPKEKCLIRLREEECKKSYGCSDKNLREHWRGETVAGGSSFGMCSTETEQLSRERTSAQDAVEKIRQQARLSRTHGSSVVRPARRGSSVTTPILVDKLPHNSVPPHLKPSASASVRRPSAISVPMINRTTCSTAPVDLTVNGDLIIGLHFGLFTQQKRQMDRLLRSREKPRQAEPRSDSLDIIDIDASIKTTSKRGVAERRVEARTTTHFSQLRNPKRDHNAAFPNTILWRPILTEQNIQSISPDSAPSASKIPRHQRQSSPTDSELTVGKEISPSVIIRQEGTNVVQSKAKGQRMASVVSSKIPGIYTVARPETVSERTTKALQRYTFGDSFCGCGGVSRGARMAGLRLKWAFDHERAMCDSYLASFPDVTVDCCSAFDYTTSNRPGTKVDILHLSPPCQFFSPAHTIVGQNDESNTASSFVIFELLKRVRPRIVTLENTMGLQHRHPLYLNAVIQQFTTLGFSIRWQVIDLRDFGVPQSRRRLIMIAAG